MIAQYSLCFRTTGVIPALATVAPIPGQAQQLPTTSPILPGEATTPFIGPPLG